MRTPDIPVPPYIPMDSDEFLTVHQHTEEDADEEDEGDEEVKEPASSRPTETSEPETEQGRNCKTRMKEMWRMKEMKEKQLGLQSRALMPARSTRPNLIRPSESLGEGGWQLLFVCELFGGWRLIVLFNLFMRCEVMYAYLFHNALYGLLNK